MKNLVIAIGVAATLSVSCFVGMATSGVEIAAIESRIIVLMFMIVFSFIVLMFMIVFSFIDNIRKRVRLLTAENQLFSSAYSSSMTEIALSTRNLI